MMWNLDADSWAHLFNAHATLADDERQHVWQRVSSGSGTLSNPTIHARSSECCQSNVCSIDGGHTKMTQPAGILLTARDRFQQARPQWAVADPIQHQASQQRTEPHHHRVVDDERRRRNVVYVFQGFAVRRRIHRERNSQHVACSVDLLPCVTANFLRNSCSKTTAPHTESYHSLETGLLAIVRQTQRFCCPYFADCLRYVTPFFCVFLFCDFFVVFSYILSFTHQSIPEPAVKSIYVRFWWRHTSFSVVAMEIGHASPCRHSFQFNFNSLDVLSVFTATLRTVINKLF